jgi:Type VI secretion system, TssO
MKPLNQAERRNAFLGFLILLLITVGVVITAVFFGIEVPFRDNEQLRKTLFIMQQEKQLSDSFSVAMQGAMYELENFDLKKSSASAYRVDVKIDKMRRLLKDLPDTNTFYISVVRNLEQLNEAKKKIGSLEQ